MNVDLESRIALCGENGAGKSTIIKLIVGELSPEASKSVCGYITRNNRLRIGYFAQHHVDSLDLTHNGVQAMQAALEKYFFCISQINFFFRYPEQDLGEEAIRTYYGQFGVTGNMALEPLFVLSGGQKTRVALAIVAFKNPHILVMDEPTNHLDLDAVQVKIFCL